MMGGWGMDDGLMDNGMDDGWMDGWVEDGGWMYDG